MRIPNNKARSMVQNRQSFRGSNTFGESYGESYAVYSYGYHWPLFVFKSGAWYHNSGRYSAIVAKQAGQLNPLANSIGLNSAQIKLMADNLRVDDAIPLFRYGQVPQYASI